MALLLRAAIGTSDVGRIRCAAIATFARPNLRKVICRMNKLSAFPAPIHRKRGNSIFYRTSLLPGLLLAASALSVPVFGQAYNLAPKRAPLNFARLSGLSAPRTAPARPIQQLLVRLKPGMEPVALAQRLSRLQDDSSPTPALAFVRSNQAIGWHVFRVADPARLEATIANLRQQPEVEAVEPDYHLTRLSTPLAPPNDAYWGQVDLEHLIVVLSGLDDVNSARGDDSSVWTYTWSLETINSLAAWNVYPHRYYTAADRKKLLALVPSKLPLIGVIDSGIDATHPDFGYTGNPSGGTADADVKNGGQINLSLGHNFVSGNPDYGTANVVDDVGHGTSVSGIIAAAPNNGPGDTTNGKGGIPGLGFPAQIVPIKVIDANGNGSDSDLDDALTYAADHHLVAVNVSLTTDAPIYTQSLQDAINYCWNHGTLVIAGAGNDGSTSQPTNGLIRRYPACMDHVLAVAASTYASNDPNTGTLAGEGLASYSNYGYELGVAAPGGDTTYFHNTSPNGADFGLDPIQEYVLIWTLAPTYQCLLSNPDPNNPDGAYAQLGLYGLNYGAIPGTSFATPHVTGLAALYAAEMNLKAAPGNPQRIVNAIERGAAQFNGRNDGGFDTTFGWGRIDALGTVMNKNARSATVGGLIGQVLVQGTPLTNITVTAQLVGGTKKYTAATYPDGMYHLTNVPAGRYTVSTSALGRKGSRIAIVTAGCDQLGISFNL